MECSSCTIRRTELSNSIMNDAVVATAFRRLIKHLQHRTDVQNVDLMGLAGFCRNCLADWIAEADGTLSREKAREIVYRSEEQPSELQSLMRISSAVFCLKKKKKQT